MTTNDEFGEVEPIKDEFGEVEPISNDNEFGKGESVEDQRPIVGRAQTLVTADEAKGMDSMGGVTKAALEAQQNGGPTAYADDGSFKNWLGNLWNAVSYNSSGKVTARNTAMNNQDILRGTVRKGGVEVPLTELDDSELDYLVDAAGWNGAGAYFRRFLGPWARSSEGLMQEWDRTEGAKYADPAERKAARVKYAQDLARMNVEQQESERNAAQAELEGRQKSFGAGAVSGLVTNGAYMLPYMVPHTHGVLAGVIEGMDRAQELLADRYETDEDGNIRIAAERDSTGKAIAKGAARGVIAPLIESVGGELTAKGLGKAAEMTIGKIPIFKKAGEKLVESTAGKAVSRWMKSMSRFGKATGIQSMPVEMIEELEDQITDAALALDKRDSETTGDMLGRAAGAFGDFMKPESLLDLMESMLLMQMIGGGIAHASDKSRARVPDLVLERVAGLDKKTLRDYTPEEKWAAYKAYVDKLSEEEIAEKFSKGAKAVSELTALVRKGATFDLKKEISEYKDADGNPVKPHEFQIKLDADGRPAFNQSIRTDTVTGASTVQNSMTDEQAGVTVVDNGDGKFEVIDEFHPDRTKKTDDFNDAIQTANEYALNNQRSALENRVKEDYFRSLVEGENAKFKRPAMAAHTVGDVLRAVSQDIGKQGNFHGITSLSQLFVTDENGNVAYPPMLRVGNSSQGFTCPDGTIVGILDNIGTAADMRRVLAHESGHSAGKGDAKEARKEMLARISPDTEFGAELARRREINERDGLGYSDEELREEVFSRWLERRGHNPSIGQRITHALFGKMGKLSDADLEVIASRIERDSANAAGGVEFIPSNINAESKPVEGETTQKGENNETGNGANEAQPESEEGAAGRQEGEEVARPGAAEPSRGEAPREGVVEERGESTAQQKPVAERNIVEKLTDQAPVQELPVAEVVNDDSRIPNFKEGANPETGEVEPLTGEPYDLVSNPIVVMEFKDGKKVVVTGRHRLALYKRSGRKTIAARVIREADGWTVNDAKAIDAIGNIIDEKGSVKDYVNYFNNAKPTREEAKAGGFLDRPKGQRAFGIFEGATEATKSVIDWNGTGGDGLISADQAGIIAEAAPKDANKRNGAVQRILVQKALAGLRGKKLGILARSLAEEAKTRKDTPNVGGEMQLDLFTSEDDQKLLALEEKRSDYRVKKSEEYGRIAEVLRTALAKGGKLDLNADYAKELGITDPNDRKQLAAARDRAVEKANYWETAISLDAADKAAMDTDINAAAVAGAKKREAAKAKVEAIKAKREGKATPKKTLEVAENATTTPAPKKDDETRKFVEQQVGKRFYLPMGGLVKIDSISERGMVSIKGFDGIGDSIEPIDKVEQSIKRGKWKEESSAPKAEKPPVSAPAKNKIVAPKAAVDEYDDIMSKIGYEDYRSDNDFNDVFDGDVSVADLANEVEDKIRILEDIRQQGEADEEDTSDVKATIKTARRLLAAFKNRHMATAPAPATAEKPAEAQKTSLTPVQQRYLELLQAVKTAGDEIGDALKAGDERARLEALIKQYKAELDVRKFEKDHASEKIEAEGRKYPTMRDFASLTDNGIKERIKTARTSLSQIAEETKETGSAAKPATTKMKNEADEKELGDALDDLVNFYDPRLAPSADNRASLGVPYQGSKNRIARSIVAALPFGNRFVDLFSGGGAMTHAAMLSGKYDSFRMNDVSPAGQRLFVEGMNGKWRKYKKRVTTDKEFDAIRGTPEGLAWSFNGLGRNLAKVGEDGRDRAQEQIRRVQALESLKPMAGRVETSEVDYGKVKLRKGDVVYADIPYEGTDQQGYRLGKFDKEKFVEWAQRQGVPVFVSEYSMPSGWREVSSFDVSGMRGGSRVEKLFVQEKFADQVQLGADGVNFSDPRLDPDSVPDHKEDRPFDVLLPNGKVETINKARSRSQAQSYVNKVARGLVDDKRFTDGGTVYEQGRAKYAIMARKEEAESRTRTLGYGAIEEANRRYPDATRDSGDYFHLGLKAGITHARTKSSALSVISQAIGGGVGSSRPAGLSGFVAGKTQQAVERGWRYYDDGTVVVSIFDGTPKKAKEAFADILLANVAFGGYKVTGYAEDAKGDLYAVLKGPRIKSIPEPLFEDKARFLKEHGFSKDADTRIGRGLWTKGDGYNSLVVDEEELRLANTTDGKQVALHPDIATTEFVNFSDPRLDDGFDAELFQKRVGAAARAVKVLVRNGYDKFEDFATALYERQPEGYQKLKPVLRSVWNAVADAMNLEDISRGDADRIYGIIETAEGGKNGNVRQSGNADEGNANGVQELRPAAPAPASRVEGRGAVAPREVQGGDGQPVLGGVSGQAERSNGDGRVAGELLERREVRNAPAELHEVGEQGNTPEGSVPAQGAAEPSGRRAERSESRGRLESGASDSVQPSVEATNPEEAAHKASPDKPSNYVITDEDEAWLNNSTPGEKIANNIEVIRILNDLEGEGRMPTPEEKTKLARYVGFGGFPQALDTKYKDAYEKYGGIPSGDLPVQTQAALKKLRFGLKGYDNYVQLRELLTPEEFAAVSRATIDAFYTTIDVCRAIHGALKASGFNGGRMLETSAGVGNMLGTGDYEMGANWTAVELDKTTGKILGYLYPLANVKVQGFEETQIPRGFMDAAVSNVPFGQIHLHDPEYNKQNFPIHDYFIARGVDRLRVGGVAAFITSTGTLDKMDKSLIHYLSDNGGKIVGAVRLPNSYQSKNAGTDVASDIIFIQKVKGTADNSTFARNGDMYGIRINGYFAEHPEMIFATVKLGVNKMYGGQPALQFVATKDLAELPALVKKAAEGLKYVSATEVPQADPISLDADKSGLRRGNIGMVDGRLVKREGDMLVPIDTSKIKWPKKFTDKGYTFEGAVKQFIDLRNAYHAYVDAQKNGTDDDVKMKRASLNAAYDAMIARYKSFNNEKAMRDLFDLDDADGIVLQQLEAYDLVPDGVSPSGKPKTKKANFRKSDALKKRTLFGVTRVTKADTPMDGLRISINECGRVNIPRIAELTGLTTEDVQKQLVESGHVFQNPSTGEFETRDEYLSGSVRRKLREARAAAEVDPMFNKNVEELEKVQPEDKPATKIKYQMGQRFIPNDMYRNFLAEVVFGCNPKNVTVGYDEKADSWRIEGNIVNAEYARRSPIGLDELLKRIFNGSPLTIKDRVDDGGGKYHYVLNPQKTQQAESLRDDLTAAMSKWLVATPERAERVMRSYNDLMNDDVPRKWDPDLITLDGISDTWKERANTPGYEHQKRTIARGVLGGNLCIAHCVGAGKSFEMFSICMQLRRLGLARKPMLTVPNHMVESGQVYKEFMEAYPGARVLVATSRDLSTANRRKFLAKAANGDWDCIVVPHSSFSLIGMDPKVQAEYISREIDDLREMMEAEVRANGKKGNAVKKIEKKIASKTEKMKKLLDASKKDSTVPFENIGVDYLLVDEAHNFKGLDITTRMQNVSGVTGSVSQRAQDMEMKCRYLSKMHGGDKGVIFASGTIISNSISEMYTTMRFLSPIKMQEMGVRRFDDWARAFGIVETKPMPRASGKGYQEKTRFAKFQNLVEMKKFFHSFADVVLDEDLNIPRPKMIGGKPIVHKIAADPTQVAKVEELDKRLDSFKGKYDPKIDNPLKVVTEGRLVAIDPSLLGLKSEHRRLEVAADEIYREWKESTGKLAKDGKTVLDGTQLVFCDSGVPKPKKFSKVVKTADGGFATRSGNYWQLYISAVDAKGFRHGRAVRSDGAEISFKPFIDHSRGDTENIADVYAAFDEMSQAAADYNAENKLAEKKHAAEPVGTPFDINKWLDENAIDLGYDIRFENPFAGERGETTEDIGEEDAETEEETSEEEDESADQDEKINGDVAVENMLRGRFNIYAHLKQLLVKRGIPESDIAFIHDAENADAKRALFADFNGVNTNFRGGKRILIGNTPKMGEGANVQKRLVDIHHLDVPWKPAWLIQRDGRGIRAGNLNAEIGIHRYVTEGTFDVYSYDKVSTKQQFINQAMNHDLTLDEVEDVDDAVLSAEEAKAAAAGPLGKYMLERVKLTEAMRKADLTLANQESDIRNAQLGLDYDKARLDDAVKAVDAAKERIAKFNEAKGDKQFGIEANDTEGEYVGKTLMENDEIARFLADKVNFFVRKGQEDGIIGNLYGFPVWWHERRGTSGQEPTGSIEIPSISAAVNNIPIVNRVAVITKGSVALLKSAVTRATGDAVIAEAEQAVASAQRRFQASADALAKMAVDESLPGKIDDMKVRLAEVNDILGIKDEKAKNEAIRILEERVSSAPDEKAAALLEKLKSTEKPVERKVADAEKDAVTFETPEDRIDFSDPRLDPEYTAVPPSAEEDKRLYGFTNDEIADAMKAAGMEPPKHVKKPDETLMRQADTLLSNREYMRKLAHAVFQKSRATRDYENVALGIYADQTAAILNEAKSAYEEMAADVENLPSDTDADTVDELKKQLKLLKLELAKAQREFREASVAKMQGASEQGRALRSNRIVVDALDYSYAGLRNMVQTELGGKEISEKMDEEIGRLAENFKDLDEEHRKLAVERLKAFSQKVVDDMKRGDKTSRMTPRGAGNELKRVTKNYNDALTQIEVHADEAGGTLIGLADQLYPSWGKWLRAIGEYHCYMNPDITEQGVIDAIRRDIGQFLEDNIDEETVRDILTGFGQNYRQSRYDSQRKMNDLKAQSLAKRQRDYMLETGKLPPQTGMVRDEPSEETRALRKEVQELKKDIDQQEGSPRALKGALDAAKTRVRNQIADLERAILRGEQIERSKRTIAEDAELKMLKQQRDELRKSYDEMFGSKSTLTDEQRRARAEKSLEKVLERAIERLGRARAGDFSNARGGNTVTSERIEELRNAVMETNAEIRALKKAAFPEGTPEEQAKRNAKRMQAREKAILRIQDRILSGDIRPTVRKAPPMPPEMQKQYDAMGKELKRAHQKMRELRREARESLRPAWVRKIGDAYRFVDGIWKMATASLDLTQIGNQTGSIAISHPALTAKSFKQSISAFTSEANAENIELDLLSDPTVKEAVDNKWLHWKRAGEFDENRGERVEFFDAIDRGFKIGGKTIKFTDIPLYGTAIANSDRLYATYINTVSANLYSYIVNDPGLFPKGASTFEKKMIADMINVMNGSGTLDKRTRSVVGKFFWAPGLVDSQLKRHLAYTAWHPWLASSEEDGSGTTAERARMSYLGTKEFLKSHIGAMLLGGLLFALFARDDEKDKFKRASLVQRAIMLMAPRIGHTQLDFTGGEASFMRLGEKLATGVKESGSGRKTPIRDYFGEVARFARGRVTPLISNAIAAISGADYAGQNYGPFEVLASFAPISLRDASISLWENGVEDGEWMTAVLAAALTMTGFGKGTYRKDDFKILSNRFRDDYGEVERIMRDPLMGQQQKDEAIANIRAANNLMKPENAAKVAATLKRISSAENDLKKNIQKVEVAEAKGFDTAEARKRLEAAAQTIAVEKGKAVELIRSLR